MAGPDPTDLDPPGPQTSPASGEESDTNRRLRLVEVRGFRSIRDASFAPGPIAALVGDPGTGKSNLLTAIRSVLDPSATPLPEDICRDDGDRLEIVAETAGGSRGRREGLPPDTTFTADGDLPPVLFLPARLRSGRVVASTRQEDDTAARARALLEQPGEEAGGTRGTAEAAHLLVSGIEAWTEAGITGLVLLIEEPELFLPPQTQRYLYRLIRGLAGEGNQVIYTTHSPSFLNIAHLEELVLTERHPEMGTRLVQPEPLPADDEFRAYSEFDAARSELFLARAAVLVEGLTEKLALPFVFRALGHDPDQERISIIECGGKSNIPLVGRVSRAVGIPFIAVHDRDAPAGRKPTKAEQDLNRLIAEVAGEDRRVELVPDFEEVAGHVARRKKPLRAFRRFAELDAGQVPDQLAAVVEGAVALARGEGSAVSTRRKARTSARIDP